MVNSQSAFPLISCAAATMTIDRKLRKLLLQPENLMRAREVNSL